MDGANLRHQFRDTFSLFAKRVATPALPKWEVRSNVQQSGFGHHLDLKSMSDLKSNFPQ
ncbi:hypothetical protein [Pseudomonas sp. 6D_7.1_Bac1]|uniref:hypothetical protein n=1 Tax=Pseudomonas sp. 6D_7.1_Bac1 TaxID=2971615 RepID=UPI0021C83A9C|nr:hypothetical protein [Pseudomonas sp. 6D_7.1_Bac1]MCU1750076.1 hypothetical protein [Pseudomonas sp. 6D_7.1_Bac1]